MLSLDFMVLPDSVPLPPPSSKKLLYEPTKTSVLRTRFNYLIKILRSELKSLRTLSYARPSKIMISKFHRNSDLRLPKYHSGALNPKLQGSHDSEIPQFQDPSNPSKSSRLQGHPKDSIGPLARKKLKITMGNPVL